MTRMQRAALMAQTEMLQLDIDNEADYRRLYDRLQGCRATWGRVLVVCTTCLYRRRRLNRSCRISAQQVTTTVC